MQLRSLLTRLFVSCLAITGIGIQVLAQSDDPEWATPVNLSHSGAASSPVVVAVPDGTLRILWWDAFDGLMVSGGPVSALSVPGAAGSELAAEEVWLDPARAPIPSPVESMPHIVSDVDGRAHAFWLGEPTAETGDQPLLYSRLAPGSTSWSSPEALADAASSLDATTDISGTVHVAYVQPVQIAESPSGMYYRRSRNAEAWSTATPIRQSRYLRLLPSQVGSIRLTADDSESVYATWPDPRRGQLLVAHTVDGGDTWHEPRPVAPSDGAPLQNRVLTLPGQAASLLWKPAGQGQSLLAVSSADDALLLAAWDGGRWSETRRLALRLQDPESGASLHLSGLHLALAAVSPDQEQAGLTLVVLGLDQNQDLRITGIQTEALERLLELSRDPSGSQSQEDQEGARLPAGTNLSRSGAASNPTVVAGPDDTLRAFWWDQFDGLMVADGRVLATSVLSGTQEIVTTYETWSEPRRVPLPVSAIPRILVDAAGRVHAFWIQRPAGERQAVAEVATWPLVYSRLTSDAATWLPAVTLAESVATFDVVSDAVGALHLAYVQALDTPDSPSGVYYRRTESEGSTWLAPVALDQSRYMRLLTPETAHVGLAADDTGGVYATWDDPRLEELLLAYSADGGETWEAPSPLGDSEAQARTGQLVAVPGGGTLLLWQDTRSGGICSLYQASAADVLDGGMVSGQRVLQELATCPESAEVMALGEGRVLMVIGGGTDSLTLVAWDGEEWSEPSRVSYSFKDPEMGRQVYLGNLRAAVVRLSQRLPEGDADKALVAVGTDQEGDVWATSSQMGSLDMVFAPPPPWSAPVSFADHQGALDLPAMAADPEGRIHLIWSEEPAPGDPGASLLYARRDKVVTSSGTEVRWINPTEILPSPQGGVRQPALVSAGNRLHAVWRAGQEGQIFYSQAFASDAYAASGWKEPQPLTASVAMASWPDIALDLGGSIHVVYAVPINEGRGIYHTRSDDGQSWSEARQVFDAAGAGWAMSDYPRLDVDLAGTIHVVWLRADPLGSGLAQAIYYAQSVDGGETWSEALEVAEGAYAWPQVAVSGTGEVHLLWNEATGENASWHQYSADGGLGWTRSERVPGLGTVPGPVGLMVNGSATMHLMGLGLVSGEPALLYIVWDGQRWGRRDVFHLDLAGDTPVAGISAALLPTLGQLDVVLRGEREDASKAMYTSLWHTERAVPAAVATPVPTSTPRPTETPLPTPVPTIAATPTSSFSTAPPQSSGGSVAELLPVLVPGALAVLVVAGGLALRFLRQRRRQ